MTILYDTRIDRVVILEGQGTLIVKVSDDDKDPLKFELSLETAEELMRGLAIAVPKLKAKLESVDRY